jgi:hypothetical protein
MHEERPPASKALGHIPIKIFVVAACAAIFFLVMQNHSSAQGLKLVKEVILEKGEVPEARAIVRAHDNGLIIAGTMELEAWATRTDAEGNVKWRYLIPKPSKSLYGRHPQYNGAAIMSDDSVFLCGEMSDYDDDAPSRPLLTHLDKDGKYIHEDTHISPQINKEAKSGAFEACAVSQDGIIAIGQAAVTKPVTPSSAHPAPYDDTFFYWVVALDIEGQVKWEKLIPIADQKDGAPDDISSIQIMPDGSFVFAAYRFGTEIIRIGVDGNIIKRKSVPERYGLMQSLNGGSNINLISYSSNPLHVLKLDGDLDEISHISKSSETTDVRIAYQLPDQSLLVFGAYKPRWDASYATVYKYSSALSIKDELKLTHPPDTSIWVTTATSTGVPNQFACTREVLTHDPKTKNTSTRVGLALDFIDVRQP